MLSYLLSLCKILDMLNTEASFARNLILSKMIMPDFRG